MQRRQFQVFVALLACLSFAMAKTSVAGKVKFPSDDPAFTVEFPSGWTCGRDKDGTLNCDPHDDSGWAFSIVPLTAIHSEKELKAELPQLAKSMASGARLKVFKMGDLDTTENGSGVRFIGAKGAGKADGMTFVVLANGFEAQKGRFYAMVTAGLEKADKKHANDYEGIAASIEPLSSGSKGQTAESKSSVTEKDASAGNATSAREQQSGEPQRTSTGLPAKYADFDRTGLALTGWKVCGDYSESEALRRRPGKMGGEWMQRLSRRVAAFSGSDCARHRLARVRKQKPWWNAHGLGEGRFGCARHPG
jgi:hypothetical protein